jgi:hypothetical protein
VRLSTSHNPNLRLENIPVKWEVEGTAEPSLAGTRSLVASLYSLPRSAM